LDTSEQKLAGYSNRTPSRRVRRGAGESVVSRASASNRQVPHVNGAYGPAETIDRYTGMSDSSGLLKQQRH